ncbi:hypothetical protein V1358_15095 [Pseudoalteromonas sp. YIC-656]|uniref:hypothetical protein n=1 Tax=Pseudoalteromonas pernae TaxID=3118054 RepID=UPI003241DA06
MNYKKGLVALAITGALATPFANAGDIRAFGGQDTTPSNVNTSQMGPQAGVAGQMNFYMNGINPVVADDLTIDQILAGQVIDLDADGTPATNGPFIGSNRTDVSVGYTTNVTIPNEATFELVINNYGVGAGFDATAFAANNPGGLAASLAGDLVLVAQESGSDIFQEVGGAIDVTIVNGVIVRALIQIDTNIADVDGDVYVSSVDGSGLAPQVQGDAIEANAQLFLATRDAAGVYNPVSVELTSVATKGDMINLSFPTVTNTAGLQLTQLATGNTTLVTISDGFELQVVDQATSTIEVETDRTTFADCETWDEVLETNASADYTCGTTGSGVVSRAKLMFASTSDVGLDINGANTVSYVLERQDGESVSGVDTVSFGTVTATKNAANQYVGTGTLLGTGLLDATNVRREANLDIEVNGIDPLFPNAQDAADWVLSSVEISGGTLTGSVNVPVVYGETQTTINGTLVNRDDAESVAVDGVTHVWDIDGAQFKVPYVYSIPGAAGWSSTIKVTNEFVTPAGIEADIIVAPIGLGAKTDAGNTFIGVDLPEMIPGEGQYTFSGMDLIKAINAKYPGSLDESANWHIEATFLVNAPQNYVHAAAQNTSPDGRADSPVLYKTNNDNDGRQWQ